MQKVVYLLNYCCTNVESCINMGVRLAGLVIYGLGKVSQLSQLVELPVGVRHWLSYSSLHHNQTLN